VIPKLDVAGSTPVARSKSSKLNLIIFGAIDILRPKRGKLPTGPTKSWTDRLPLGLLD
jgi:hypothetical protein